MLLSRWLSNFTGRLLSHRTRTGATGSRPNRRTSLANCGSSWIVSGKGVGHSANFGERVESLEDRSLLSSLSISDATVLEGDAGTVNAVFVVTLTSTDGAVVTVDVSSADNTAVSPSDYTAFPLTTLTFTPGVPGVTTMTVTVPVNGDTLDEANETFFVNLTTPTNSTISDAQGLGTIVDDDAATATVTLSVSPSALAETGGTSTVTATLSAISGQNVIVDLPSVERPPTSATTPAPAHRS